MAQCRPIICTTAFLETPAALFFRSMKLRSLLSACLLVTFRDSFVDSRSVEKDGVGLAQKHSNLGKLLGGTPVEKASQFGLDENHKKGQSLLSVSAYRAVFLGVCICD